MKTNPSSWVLVRPSTALTRRVTFFSGRVHRSPGSSFESSATDDPRMMLESDVNQEPRSFHAGRSFM